jgi:hypothetical protein
MQEVKRGNFSRALVLSGEVFRFHRYCNLFLHQLFAFPGGKKTFMLDACAKIVKKMRSAADDSVMIVADHPRIADRSRFLTAANYIYIYLHSAAVLGPERTYLLIRRVGNQML